MRFNRSTYILLITIIVIVSLNWLVPLVWQRIPVWYGVLQGKDMERQLKERRYHYYDRLLQAEERVAVYAPRRSVETDEAYFDRLAGRIRYQFMLQLRLREPYLNHLRAIHHVKYPSDQVVTKCSLVDQSRHTAVLSSCYKNSNPINWDTSDWGTKGRYDVGRLRKWKQGGWTRLAPGFHTVLGGVWLQNRETEKLLQHKISPIQQLSLTPGHVEAIFPLPWSEGVVLVQQSRPGNMGRSTTKATLYSFTHERVTKVIANAGSTLRVVASADRERWAIASDNQLVTVFETETGRELCKWKMGGSVSAMELSPDGFLLATIENKLAVEKVDSLQTVYRNVHQLIIRRIPDGEVIQTIYLYTNISSINWSLESKYLLLTSQGSNYSNALVLDWTNKKTIWQQEQPDSVAFATIRYPNVWVQTVRGNEGEIKRYNLRDGSLQTTLTPTGSQTAQRIGEQIAFPASYKLRDGLEQASLSILNPYTMKWTKRYWLPSNVVRISYLDYSGDLLVQTQNAHYYSLPYTKTIIQNQPVPERR